MKIRKCKGKPDQILATRQNVAYSRPDTDQATMHRAVAAPHSPQQSRFYLRKSTHLSARRDGGVPGRALLCRRGGSASSRPDAPPRLLISAKWGSSARRRSSATRAGCFALLGLKGALNPVTASHSVGERPKQGLQGSERCKRTNQQQLMHHFVLRDLCLALGEGARGGGSPWQRIAEAGRRTDGGRSHAMNLAHSAGSLKDGHG